MVKSNYKYISGSSLINKLNNYFELKIVSQKWSHIKVIVWWIKTVIPNHKELAYGTFSSILKQLKIDEGEFLKLK